MFLTRMIEAEEPDFIDFTGDNIFGTSSPDAAESMFEAFGPVMESRLPWAAILGNHDQESTMTRVELMSFISLMDYSVSQTNPLAEETSDSDKESLVRDIDGFGNYNLRVWGAPGSHLANHSVLNLYFLDSGDRAIVGGVRTYGWIKESQLRWLRDVSKAFQLCFCELLLEAAPNNGPRCRPPPKLPPDSSSTPRHGVAQSVRKNRLPFTSVTSDGPKTMDVPVLHLVDQPISDRSETRRFHISFALNLLSPHLF
ncbi:putative inactive purple acid phosphatase 28 [Camellia lanceoleosa]|uniref:Inactive purple acid phosphatase 28 n=1 Tax=Camellia lanceoleosa TaxID=1840588 RepID=A0ACC0H0C0_9ERIC|nr:putative inactive purple acid phosphatase 28 [Camellia lanceoleosa]